jgi:Na+-driven multidrug efflux pump
MAIFFTVGVLGAAWSSVISSSATLVFLLIYCWCKLKMEFMRDVWSGSYNFGWIKVWSKVGFFSALDSLIRNVVYLVVVLRAMNLLQEQVKLER